MKENLGMYPIQGDTLAAPMPEGLVLDAAAHLVESFVGRPDHMERNGDLAGEGSAVS